MKGIGTHPESICCFLWSLQSNAIGTGKMDKEREVSLFLFFFALTSPSLYSGGRNWRLENTAAPGILPTTSFFFSQTYITPCLGSKPISGSALVVKDWIQNWRTVLCSPLWECFYFQCSSFRDEPSSDHQTWPQKFSPCTWTERKLNPFHWNNDSRNWCYKAILKYFIIVYIWCLNSVFLLWQWSNPGVASIILFFFFL